MEIKVDKSLEEKTKKKVKVSIAEGKEEKLDFNQLKSGGFIKQRQKDLFTVRLRCPGGRVPLEKLKKVAEVAEKYGKEYIHLSNRQSLEIPYVNYKDFSAMIEELKEVDQRIASCGPRVRVPTACSGCEYNPNGITDTQKMAAMVDKEFFGFEVYHKFKISFSGCPIDCFRTNEMDLGFQGAVEPLWTEDKCNGCRICSFACTEAAILSHPETGKPLFDIDKCLYCGDCIRACPTDSWVEGKKGWIVRVGGRHGRHPLNGSLIATFIPDEMVSVVITEVLQWYKKNGEGRGRTRIGALLQDKDLWKSFKSTIKKTLGEYFYENCQPPTNNEIHFYQDVEKEHKDKNLITM